MTCDSQCSFLVACIQPWYLLLQLHACLGRVAVACAAAAAWMVSRIRYGTYVVPH